MMLRNNRMYSSLFWSILLLSSMEPQISSTSESSKMTTSASLLLRSYKVSPAPAVVNRLSTPVPSESTGNYSLLAADTQTINGSVGVIMGTATAQDSTWAKVAMEETTNPRIHHIMPNQVPTSNPPLGVFPTSKMILTAASDPLVHTSAEQIAYSQTTAFHLHPVHIAHTGQITTLPRTMPHTYGASTKQHSTPSTVAPLKGNSESASTFQSSSIDATSLSQKSRTNSMIASVTSPSNPTKGPTSSQSSSTIATSDSAENIDVNSTFSSISPEASTTTEFNPTTSFVSSSQSVLSSSTRPSTISKLTANKSSPTTKLTSITSAILSPTNSTNSSLEILVPGISKKLLISTIHSSTIKPSAPNNVSQQGGILPCSTTHRNRLVGQCLIAVASLAGVATIFMVCTIILCTKLSSRKQLYKMRREEREMVCISALMSEENISYGKHHLLKSNRVLLPPMRDESDEEGGDNLTLKSFLPENDSNV